MNSTIYHDVLIHSNAQKVFDAITLPKHFTNWWPLKCTGTPSLDAEYNFHFSDEYNWFAKIQKIDSPNSIEYLMTNTDQDWNNTTVEFHLEQKNNAINLQFSHLGWRTINHHYRRTSYCWALLLKGLKGYVEEGTVIPFGERA